MISILINAYACSPSRGSEPGMAWNWILNLSKYCRLYVITEGEWQNEIEDYLQKNNLNHQIKFYYNPVSDSIREMCWNQGDWRFYYYYKAWQKSTLILAKKIIKDYSIDVIHQLNMIGFREPGYLWTIKEKPFVWGPIGGVKNIPEAYLHNADFKLRLFLKLKNRINNYQIRNNKRVHKALFSASQLISAIPESQRALKNIYNLDSELIPETGCYLSNSEILASDEDKECFSILWVGKFDFRKQLNLALKSISKSKNLNRIKLHIVGTGKLQEMKYFKGLAKKMNIENQVVWHGLISNQEVLSLMSKSQLFFFTSISDDTSTVIMEALSRNLPVLCFDACGFGSIINEYVGAKIPFSNPDQSVNEFSEIIDNFIQDRVMLEKLSENCTQRRLELSWDKKALKVVNIYEKILQ